MKMAKSIKTNLDLQTSVEHQKDGLPMKMVIQKNDP